MKSELKGFQKIVWDYFGAQARDLPWRQPEKNGVFDPYKIMVSEIMLQQTQVGRVIPKYQAFLKQFPTLQSLAEAPLADVIKQWSGLGYNRRAKYLHDAAKTTVSQYNGRFPTVLNTLINLPGIGANTAAAILVYSYNQPLVFIETNIRSVYLHHFFADQVGISDKQLLPLVAETLDQERPREWYWALMDYGSFLKSSQGNANQRSRHYKKQSTFYGSLRQLRGAILRELANGLFSQEELSLKLADERTADALAGLARDGLVQKDHHHYRLAE